MTGGVVRRLPTVVLALIVPVVAVVAVLVTLNATSDDNGNASSSGATLSVPTDTISPSRGKSYGETQLTW